MSLIGWLTRKCRSDNIFTSLLCKRTCPVRLDVSSLWASSGCVSKGQAYGENVECSFPQAVATPIIFVARISVDSIWIAVPGESRYWKCGLIIIRILHHRFVDTEGFKSRKQLGGRPGGELVVTNCQYWDHDSASTFEELFGLRATSWPSMGKTGIQ